MDCREYSRYFIDAVQGNTTEVHCTLVMASNLKVHSIRSFLSTQVARDLIALWEYAAQLRASDFIGFR